MDFIKRFPKLQLALDVGERPALIRLAHLVEDHIDWIEAGTPWILAEGMKAVRALRAEFPQKGIIADMKIADGGYYEACLGFKAGANLVTCLGTASDITIQEVIRAARRHTGEVIVDLLNIPEIQERARQLTLLGVNYLCVHTAFDLTVHGQEPISDLEKLAIPAIAPLIAAGGIGLHNIRQVVACRPAAVIVGRALTEATDPLFVAQQLRQELAVIPTE